MELDLGAAYWNQRYHNDEAGWDAGVITEPLKAYFDQLDNKSGSILIPGAGNGHEVEYLFQQGFSSVYLCDLAEAPLQNFLKRCPDFNRQHVLHSDFFELTDLDFDLIIEQTFFCALDPALRSAYFEKVAQLLKPGGRLVGLLFNDTLNTDKPPFGGNKEEYMGYITPAFRVHTFDVCYNSIKPRQGRELFINLEKLPSTEL